MNTIRAWVGDLKTKKNKMQYKSAPQNDPTHDPSIYGLTEKLFK